MARPAKRTKALNCLFRISRLVHQSDKGLEAVLQETVDMLPSAWAYPQITCARILLNDQQYKSSNFQETEWKQVCNIKIKGHLTGTIEILYRLQMPPADEGPFSKKERDLLDAVGELLGEIIEHRQADTALEKSEKRFRNLVENSLTGISIIQNSQVVYQNQELERLLGPLPRSTVLGDYKIIHPGDVEKIKQLSRDISAGKIPTLDVEFRLFPMGDKNDRRNMKWVYCRATSIEYQGRHCILVNMIDTTQTKKLEDLLIMQDKMASLGRVAAGIAHEIRNPLSGINIYLNTLEKIYHRPDNHARIEQILEQLKSASKKIESVIRRVMDFARPGEPKLVLAQINPPIEEALQLTAVTMRKSGIKIEKRLADNLPPCYADAHLIEEAVLNLLNNAAEAMKTIDGLKKITITSGMENDRIYIKISDSGPGVPAHIKDKIFDPFYSTKYEGTGIGLSICHRIITDHNGSLIVSENESGGAEFRIEIPAK